MEAEKVKSKFPRRLLKFGAWFFGSILTIMLLISGGIYFYKDEICGIVIEEVNQHLKAKVSVEKVDLAFWGSFPNLSVDFNNVFIQDSYENSTPKDTLLHSERIRLKFNPMDIWEEKYDVKQIEVAPGTVQLKINKKGEVNYDILKPTKDTTASKFKLQLKEVILSEIRFSYDNQSTGQAYSSNINELELAGAFSEKQFVLESKTQMLIKHIKSGNIPLISNKLSHFNIAITVNQELGTIEIPTCTIYIANLPFEFGGKITPTDLNFKLKANQLELKDFANNFQHSSIDNIDKFGGSGTVDFDVSLNGKIDTEEPLNVECNFGIQEGSLIDPIKKLKINNIKLKGKYSNIGGKDKEFLKLSNISFSTPGGPFKGNVLLTHFDAPIIEGNANGNINLKVANSLFTFPGVQEIGGNIQLNSEFIVQALTQNDNSLKYDLQTCEGDIDLQNVQLHLVDDKRNFRDVNGSIYLRDDEAGIDHVSLKVGSSDLKIDGVFNDIVGFLRKESKIKANIDVQSNFLNVQDLSTETKQEQISNGRNWILPNNVDGSVSVNIGDLKYENHNFKELVGKLKIGERIINFPDITLKNAGALIKGSVTIEERDPEVFTISTKAISDNVEFKPLFREWNNFEQDVITENNIFGKVHVTMDFEAPFDLRTGIIKNAIKSKVQLRITEGRLKNVMAFKSLTESLKSTSATKLVLNKNNINEFEKKLLDLKFGTLENTFIIRNGKLEIPSMVIESNALDVKLEGTHDFDNNIDYRFAFRFRDLKQPSKSEAEFGEIVDDGTGVKLYVRMTGNMDNPTIVWDENAKKQQAKENREAAKEDAKSILKTEFGLFKNDSSVKTYKQSTKPKEELKVEFGPEKPNTEEQKQKEPKKDTKITNTLKKWKQEAENTKKEEFE